MTPYQDFVAGARPTNALIVGAAANAPTRSATPAMAVTRRLEPADDAGAGSAAADGVFSASSISNRASAASDSRRLRSFSRQRRNRRRMAGCVVGASAFQSGSVFSTDASVSETVAPSNRRFPVSISHSTTPKPHKSARLSAVVPRACSGDMYAAVPRIMPACVIAGVVSVGDIEALALHQLHYERGDATAFFEAIDRGDVRMIQRGQGLRFTLEARQAVCSVRERLGQDLDRDVAIQLCIARAKDMAHTPFADLGGDFIDAEARAGGECQTSGLYGRRVSRTRRVPGDAASCGLPSPR